MHHAAASAGRALGGGDRHAGVSLVGSLAVSASARLPHPRTTLIVPGSSIGGVKLAMNRSQVFHQWGSTTCIPGVCTWAAGSAFGAERATVSFYQGEVIQVDINAGTSGTSLRFKPGVLSRWRTARHISLGSTKAAVKRAYPSARANRSTGVNGWDLFYGGGAGLHFMRFSTFGAGISSDRVRYIELACSHSRC